jgi:hypothetical protein
MRASRGGHAVFIIDCVHSIDADEQYMAVTIQVAIAASAVLIRAWGGR